MGEGEGEGDVKWLVNVSMETRGWFLKALFFCYRITWKRFGTFKKKVKEPLKSWPGVKLPPQTNKHDRESSIETLEVDSSHRKFTETEMFVVS